MICDVCGMGTRCNCWARGKTMIRDKYSESLQEGFCDELERHANVLARRYDPIERDRLMQAAATLHTWLSSLDSEHQEAAANLTCADLANAFATTVGGLRAFGCTNGMAGAIIDPTRRGRRETGRRGGRAMSQTLMEALTGPAQKTYEVAVNPVGGDDKRWRVSAYVDVVTGWGPWTRKTRHGGFFPTLSGALTYVEKVIRREEDPC